MIAARVGPAALEPSSGDDEVVPFGRRVTAELADPAGDALQTIGLLHPELPGREEPRVRPGVRGEQGQHRHLVDDERELLGLDLTDRGRPRATPRCADGLAQFLVPDRGLGPHAHPLHHVEELVRPSGLRPTSRS